MTREGKISTNRVKVKLLPTVSRPVYLSVMHLFGAHDHIFCYCQLWVCWCGVPYLVYNCLWSSPAQSLSDPSPAGLPTIFYCLRFETPPTWSASSPYLSIRIDQLHPKALRSILFTSYDIKGYVKLLEPFAHGIWALNFFYELIICKANFLP
jgi:hypothetical protein